MAMQYASLTAFLSGALAPELFADEIASEVANFYSDLNETRHGLIRISDGPPFIMTRAAARRLLDAVKSKRLSDDAAVYVADCIVASDAIEFADEATRDAVSFLEDDSHRFIEGADQLWTPEDVAMMLASLD